MTRKNKKLRHKGVQDLEGTVTLHWMDKLRKLMREHPDDPKQILALFHEWGQIEELRLNKEFGNYESINTN